MKIAILGWGSLLWDKSAEFGDQIQEWLPDGPNLMLEFSRISQSRGNALTLVLDAQNGAICKVSYAFSKRKNPDDAICDLRCREGTTLKNIGFYFADESRSPKYRDAQAFNSIQSWALERKIDVTVWTDLESNFQKQSNEAFSVEAALAYLQIDAVDKAKAAQYVQRAPQFIDTPLRKELQVQPWFLNQLSKL
ncbi:hypothetical protein [Methylomicrobium lacus]|uniref:hypothetical protein n=1 Tax=Methylomicrobium lacus TaxID=136992 RepID=UPI00045EAC83|nr:hypothetical protein [Methylomicrobium lacus]